MVKFKPFEIILKISFHYVDFKQVNFSLKETDHFEQGRSAQEINN